MRSAGSKLPDAFDIAERRPAGTARFDFQQPDTTLREPTFQPHRHPTHMNRRGFVTTGAAGLVGASTSGALLGTLATPGPARALATQPDETIRLSSNENPLGLSPKAREAAEAALDLGNRYPHAHVPPLREALAAYVGVKDENLVLGAGSTDLLQMTLQAYAGSNVPLVIAQPTFEDVSSYQGPFDYELTPVPLTDALAHDVGRMREIADRRRRPSIVYFCNPNNPTGTITKASEIDAWIADAPETTLFIMDEAYVEYVTDPDFESALKWIDSRPNVVVVRTFSKIFGMAGMRLGYLAAHPDTAERIAEFVAKSNVSIPTLHAGLASLQDDGLVARSQEVNEAAKKIVTDTCRELGLETLPTNTNFLMHRINGDLRTYIGRMRDAGLLVGRPFPPMLGWNRLSFGLPEEQGRWAETIRSFRQKGWV